MNQDLERLQPYPFERLNQLKAGITPVDKPHIALSIGEPKHKPPQFVTERLIEGLSGLANYPLTKGSEALRASIAHWLTSRYALKQAIDPDKQVLPVAGTREALFAFAQTVVNRDANALVMMPNPFYQIYEGATLLAGAAPYFLNTTSNNNNLPDIDSVSEEEWQRCQLFYLCSPANPTGAVAPIELMQRLINLAEKYDFIIASDECYSELYFDEASPPPGLLQAAQMMGNDDYKRCVVFHSLSKRSNLPGLRSGFVAGDSTILKKFLLYRTYHGCALPPHTQMASIAAWDDEQHVIENRQLYRQKYIAVLDILSPYLDVIQPEGGFYLWPNVGMDDTEFAQKLFQQQNITVLPGSYLSRTAHAINPGKNRIRMALVASYDECIEAAERITDFIKEIRE